MNLRPDQDYFIGDIVQLENEFGIKAKAKITEMIDSFGPEGEQIVSTFRVISKSIEPPLIFDPKYLNGPTKGSIGTLPSFFGGIIVSEEKIILIPTGSPNIGIYDIGANTYINGPTQEGAYSFCRGCLLPNRKILFVSDRSDHLGLYDFLENIYTPGPFHGKGSGATAKSIFTDGILMPNSKVLLVPGVSPNIGLYDPITNTYTDGPTHGKISTTEAFCRGVLIGDKVILIPFRSPNIGIYDILTNSYRDGPIHETEDGFENGVLLPNNKILFTPYLDTDVFGIYDPISNIYINGPDKSSIIGAPSNPPRTFDDCLLLDNGKVILITNSDYGVYFYDYRINTVEIGPTYSNGGRAFYSGVSMPNGRVLLIPGNSSRFGLIDLWFRN